MIFTPSPLVSAYVIELDRRGDDRGWFARSFCAREFEEHGLASHFVQANTSRSAEPGTMRGLHYQTGQHAEAKLMRCIQGATWNVIADLRPDSATYGQSFGVELSAETGTQLFVPRGFANGFLTLKPDTIAAYMSDNYYEPDAEAGLRFDDPSLGFEMPIPVTTVNEKDRSWPLFETIKER
ncbi:MAG: dTDP-4-dehydrorhamnose 3,5-epimerase [Pseudomonadota bacterium]